MDGKSKLAVIAYQKGQLIGQYKILEVLKQGQFTDTFLGRELEGKIPVMIKVLRPPLISELENDFLTQARVLMEMRHPHILPILDVGMDNHNPFLVTKYVSHVTLRQLFPRGRVQPLTAFLPYIKQIASALQYAHDRPVLHGDLRLRNVLLNTDNQILLTDFTIETILQNRTRLNYKHDDSIVYSAPEMIQGKPLPASDQYSMGIIVYKLLSGEAPFTKSYFEIANQHINTPPPSLREKVPGISPSIEKIVMIALSKEPTKRFTTIQAFVNALEQAENPQLRGSLSHITPPPVVPQQVRPPTIPIAIPTEMPAQSPQHRQSAAPPPSSPSQLPPPPLHPLSSKTVH